MTRVDGYTQVRCNSCMCEMFVFTEGQDLRIKSQGWDIVHGKDYCPRCTPSKAMFVQIWTDGSSDGKGPTTRPPGDPGIGGWAFVASIPTRSKEVYQYSSYARDATNNSMELMAILQALQWKGIEQGAEVHVYTDSDDCVKWLTGKWRLRAPNLVPLGEMIATVVQQASLNVQYHHVRAHEDNELNNMTDVLAGRARQCGLGNEKDGQIVRGRWVDYDG